MTPRVILSSVLFGGAMTVAELWVVAQLSAPGAKPEPLESSVSQVIVAPPPLPPPPPEPILPPLQELRTSPRQANSPPRPAAERARLPALARVSPGLNLASALPSLSDGLGSHGFGAAGMGEPDAHAIPRRRPSPNYPLEARRRGIEGFVVVRMRVDTSGRVEDAVVVESRPQGIFDQSAKSAALAYRFTPARSHGRPVPTTVEQRMRFALR